MDPMEMEPTTSEPPATTIPPPVDLTPPVPQPESSSAPPPQPTPPPAATPPSIPPTTPETPTQTLTAQTPPQQQPHSQTQPKPQFQPQPLTQPSQNQRPHMPTPSLTRSATRPMGSFSHFHQKVPGSSPSTSSAVVIPPPSQTTSSTAMQRGGLAIGVPAAAHPRSGPVPFSSFGPTPSFGQSFGAGVAEQSSSSSSNPQTRPSIQGIQNIGMIGSLNTASHTRHASVSTQLHQRPSQSTVRSITPGISPSPNVQKLPNQGLARVSSLASPVTGPAQSTQPLHQPWMSGQARPVHASSLSSSSYRPSVRPQNLQQRPTPQPQQQYQIPQKQLQQQQKQQQAVGTQSQQQPLAKNHANMPQQQPAPRAASQKPQVPTTAQPGLLQPGTPFPVVNSEDADSGTSILSKRSIRELVSQVDPSEKLDPEVEDILVEIADDFIESITTVACSLAKHRKSNTLEAKDILLHLERNWNITLPGFGGDEIKGYKKPSAADVVHKERLSLIKKSMAGTPEAGNAKTSTPGQSNTNVKSHVAKAPLIGSPKLL